MNIVDDMISSKGLAENSRKTYVRYIRDGCIKIKHKVMFPLPIDLCEKALATQTIVITPLDEQTLYTPSEEYIVLIIQAAAAFVMTKHKPAPLQANDFHSHTRKKHDKFRVRHLEQGEKQFSAFALFLEFKIQQTKITSYSILSLFVSDIRPFEHDRRDRSKEWEQKAEARKDVFC